MATNGLPITFYEDLLPKLIAVLELTQQTVGISTPQAKQKLLQTVCYSNITSHEHSIDAQFSDEGL